MTKLIRTATLVLLALCAFATAQDDPRLEWNYIEQYVPELARHKQREEAAKSKIATLEKEVAALQAQIAEVKKQQDDKWSEMLAFVGITQEEFDAFSQKLDDFITKVRGFESEFADDFKGWNTALKGAEGELSTLKKDPVAIFPRLDKKFANGDQAISDSRDALRAAMAAAAPDAPDTYTVRLIPERRDCLWRIAEYDDIYGDPFQWPKIYSANKGEIRDPDLIFPGQVFQIPR